MSSDFNLHDAFHIFDPLNKSYISSYDFERALNALRIYAASDESDLVIKHYSKGGARISFSDFSGLFDSRDLEYARILNARPRDGRRMFAVDTAT